jgi:hypothetical protein
MPLKERLSALNFNVTLASQASDYTGHYLDELIAVVDQAILKKDYNLLGYCLQLTQKLNGPCFAHLERCPDLAWRFIEHFKVEPNTFTSFLTGAYRTLPQSLSDALLAKLVENVLKHETYFDLENPRRAEQLLEAVLGESWISEPATALVKAIVLTNTDKFCGAGFVIRAIHSAKGEHTDEFDYVENLLGMVMEQGLDTNHLRTPLAELRAKHKNVNEVNQAVLTWVRENQQIIADSILAGPATAWITDDVVRQAQSMNLPTIVNAMAIRSYEFTFELMSELYTAQGVLSDDRHLRKAKELPAHEADMLAFSLVHENILGDFEFGQDIVEVTESALDKIGNMSFNLLSIHTVVGKLVEQIDIKADVSTLTDSRLGPHLQRFRKFNGMRLEDELGL